MNKNKDVSVGTGYQMRLDIINILPDYRETNTLYFRLGKHCARHSLRCPMLIILKDEVIEQMRENMEISEDEPYFVTHSGEDDGKIIWCMDSLSDDEIFNITTKVIDDDQTEIDMNTDFCPIDMTEIYLLASTVGAHLRISLPQIIIMDTHCNMSGGGLLINQPGNPQKIQMSKALLLKAYGLAILMSFLLHELRHVWQHQYEPRRYFKKYDVTLVDRDPEKYCLQDAEIDAEAFSVRGMEDIFDIKITSLDKYPSVDRKVMNRARSLPKVCYPWAS